MLRQSLHQIDIATRGRGFYEFTDRVQSLLEEAKLHMGAATLHVQHTSASLLIQENADPEVRRDFERFFARLVPDGDALFRHTEEGEDDMPAHIRSALTAVSLTIPFSNGRLTLGTWQGIYLWEHRRRGHRRQITVYFIGE
jgi:secondary thiamine-phosphate synthase enzyme